MNTTSQTAGASCNKGAVKRAILSQATGDENMSNTAGSSAPTTLATVIQSGNRFGPSIRGAA
jgi:hypothetical protein